MSLDDSAAPEYSSKQGALDRVSYLWGHADSANGGLLQHHHLQNSCYLYVCGMCFLSHFFWVILQPVISALDDFQLSNLAALGLQNHYAMLLTGKLLVFLTRNIN